MNDSERVLRSDCRRRSGSTRCRASMRRRRLSRCGRSIPTQPSASTDVGDVSWTVPTIGFDDGDLAGRGALRIRGRRRPRAGMSIGQEGMVVASKALALTALDLFTDPALVRAAKDGLREGACGKDVSICDSGGAEAVDRLPGEIGHSDSAVSAREGCCCVTGQRSDCLLVCYGRVDGNCPGTAPSRRKTSAKPTYCS